MNKLQEYLAHSTGNVATLDDFEIALPANESRVEWAIKRIDGTLRKKQSEPDWTDHDIASFEDAARLCVGANQGVRRKLKRRFSLSSGRLAGYIVKKKLHPSWSDLGKRLRGTSPILDSVFTMQAAIELIERCLAPNGARNISNTEEAHVIRGAQEAVKIFRTELPKHIWESFRQSIWTLQAELRERYADPDWIALAQAADLPVPSIEWIQDVESAIEVMAELTNSDSIAEPSAQVDSNIRHLCRVVRRFGRTGSYSLPALVSERLLDAIRDFAAAVLEKPRPHLLKLKEKLRIDRTPDGRGCTCGGLTLYPRVDFKKVLTDSDCDKMEPRLPPNPRLTLRLMCSLPDGTRLMSNRLDGFAEVLTTMNRQELWRKAKLLCIDQRTCWVNPPINLFNQVNENFAP